MASTDVVMLCSSPLKQFQSHSLIMSSSPLPSPSGIGKKEVPILRRESNVAIPSERFESFISTSTVIETSKLPDPVSFQVTKKLPPEESESELKSKSKAKTTVKSRAKKAVEKKDGASNEKPVKPPRKPTIKKPEAPKEKGEKKPRKSRAKKAKVLADGEGIGEKKPVSRKPRAKKAESEKTCDEVKQKPTKKTKAVDADGQTQTKLPKGRVTKSSAHPKPGKNEEKEETVEADSIDYGLVKATKRRTNWSPTSAASYKDYLTPADPTDADVVSPDPRAFRGFNDLLGSFGFTSSAATIATERKNSEGGVVRKRKLIELIKTNIATPAGASPKIKAPKKKARTITGLAISAYEVEMEEEIQSAPLLQYFTCQTTERNSNDGKPRSKSPVKIPKAKKGSALAPILLSPESAMKQVSNQDFLFGTSSQLAREESPTYLRDLHEAMQASNHSTLDDVFDDILDDPFRNVVSEPSAAAPRGRSDKKGLWSVGARDAAGSLLDVEMVDLVDTPETRRLNFIARAKSPSGDITPSSEVEMLETPADVRATARKKATTPVSSMELVDVVDMPIPVPPEPSQKTDPILDLDRQWLDIADLISPVPRPPTVSATISKQLGPVEAEIRQQLLESPSTNASLEAKSIKAKSPKAPKSSQANMAPSFSQATKKKAPKDQMPDFEAYTAIQLEKLIAKYHFKPVKARAAMITLLKRCWEDQHNRKALIPLDTNTKPASSAKPLHKATAPSQVDITPKKRGRPRKDSTGSTATPLAKPKMNAGPQENPVSVEIEDSDVPLSQIRTPRKSPKKFKSQVPDEIYYSDPPTPSPARRHSSKITGPLPLPLKSTSTSSSQESDDQDSLFKNITRAIKSTPPTKDPSKPTWYEKILLYDPIVIQDLTGWLNVEGLGKVGWDGEVNVKDVKKWCEGRGICCLWKENLRGGSRARY